MCVRRDVLERETQGDHSLRGDRRHDADLFITDPFLHVTSNLPGRLSLVRLIAKWVPKSRHDG